MHKTLAKSMWQMKLLKDSNLEFEISTLNLLWINDKKIVLRFSYEPS